MHRRRLIETIADPFWRDLSNWPVVTVRDDVAELFEVRQAMVFDYFDRSIPVSDVLKRTPLSKSECYRLLEAAFAPTDDGGIQGWDAIVPYRPGRGYERYSDSMTNASGKFQRFMADHPDIAKEVANLHLARRSDTRLPGGRTPETVTLKEFHERCAEAGILAHEYPLNLATGGREGLRLYLRALDIKHPISSAKRDAGLAGQTNLSATSHGTENPIHVPTVPFAQVECDAHRMDLMMIVYLMDAMGRVEPYLIERVWLYVVYEYISKAILGYHLSLSPEPGLEDFLQCIANALAPWQPKELTIDGLTYDEGAGLPSGVIPACAWQTFDMIKLDNAKVHLSTWAQDQIIKTTGATIALGRVKHPIARACVERFFRWLEYHGWHRLGSTTGSNVLDPKRVDPGQYAKKHKIQLPEIEQLLDVLIANRNVELLDGVPLYGKRSPLGYLRSFTESDLFLPRTVQPRYRSSIPFRSRRFTPTVRGNKAKRRRPYVEVEHAIYRNEILDDAWHLIGQEINCDIDLAAAHTAPAHVPDSNQKLGTLLAQAPWASPHALRVRKAIMAKRNRGKFKLGNDAIRAYERFKTTEAKTSTRAASAVVNLNRHDPARQADGSEGNPIMTPVDKPLPRYKPTRKNWISAGKAQGQGARKNTRRDQT